jgi:sRNA-binding regulator protein Hfq
MRVGLAKTRMKKEEHSLLVPKHLILTINVRNFVLIELRLIPRGLKRKQEEHSLLVPKHLILTINVKNSVLIELLRLIPVGLKNNQKEHRHAPEHLTLTINVTNFVPTELWRPIPRGLKKIQVTPFSNTNTLLLVGFHFHFFFGGDQGSRNLRAQAIRDGRMLYNSNKKLKSFNDIFLQFATLL